MVCRRACLCLSSPCAGGPVALADHELDEMSKRDVEGIAAGFEAHTCGPDMTLEGNCPKCASPFEVVMDWGYDNFFFHHVGRLVQVAFSPGGLDRLANKRFSFALIWC